jgi:putative transposase
VIAGHRVERVMARPPRLHVPGGFYHVTLRGNHRQPIFFRDSDRPLLDEIVADTLARLEARLHAYCWMTNHIHILIQVSAAPLGQVVMRIASRYARTVQAGIQTTGHLFERRYHAALVDEDRYLLALIRYIHLNPVRGALVNRPGDYPWSSHHEYVGTREQPWVTTFFALQMLGTQTDSARAAYRELIDEPGELHWGTGLLALRRDNSQILGDDAFAARVATSLAGQAERRTLEDLIGETGRRFNLRPEVISSASRQRAVCTARAWLAQEAISQRIATISAIARRLGCTDTAIRRLVGRHKAISG